MIDIQIVFSFPFSHEQAAQWFENNWIEALAWLGDCVFVAAYWLSTSKRKKTGRPHLDVSGVGYNALILTQAALFFYYAIKLEAWPYLFIEVIVIYLALATIWRSRIDRQLQT